MNNSRLLELVLNVLPYSNQIKDIDMHEDKVIRFTWRGDRFRVGRGLTVEQVDGSMLTGSNAAILLQSLLKNRVKPEDM